MDRTERLYEIDRLLNELKVVPLCRFLEELEVSRSTLKRDFEYLRDRLNAPLVWDRRRGGYRYEKPAAGMPQYALPGLWFNESELYALLSMDALLTDLQPGLLDYRLAPLRKRIRTLLGSGGHAAEEVGKRIKIAQLAARPVPGNHFKTIMGALLDRLRLKIHHYRRGPGSGMARVVSPQRLVYYRDNWYLDAWCHLRRDLRCFAVDAIGRVEVTAEKACEIDEKRLDREFTSTYGIFAGYRKTDVRLRFSPECARWVAREEWHPDQRGALDDQGYYLLSLPYSHDTELLMDIMRYGPEVEILQPQELRGKIRTLLEKSLELYRVDDGGKTVPEKS